MNATSKFTNDLIHETSPYLLQHAHNPVNWKAWSSSIFTKAEQENKPILLESDDEPISDEDSEYKVPELNVESEKYYDSDDSDEVYEKASRNVSKKANHILNAN